MSVFCNYHTFTGGSDGREENNRLYIERWGRGVEKICDACKALGAEPPVYELLGNGLRIHFAALQSALVDNTKAPKHQSTGALEQSRLEQIVEILISEPNISQGELAERLGISRRVVQTNMTNLKKSGRIERVGGKRYGYWKVVK